MHPPKKFQCGWLSFFLLLETMFSYCCCCCRRRHRRRRRRCIFFFFCCWFPTLYICFYLVAGIRVVFFISLTRCLFNQIIYCYILCHLILLLIFLNYGKLINIHLEANAKHREQNTELNRTEASQLGLREREIERETCTHVSAPNE